MSCVRLSEGGFFGWFTPLAKNGSRSVGGIQVLTDMACTSHIVFWHCHSMYMNRFTGWLQGGYSRITPPPESLASLSIPTRRICAHIPLHIATLSLCKALRTLAAL